MQFDEMGNRSGKTLMLLPGTACDYQTNFAAVLDRLGEKYHLICVNYDGFDGSGEIFPDMITVTEKIEKYIKDNHGGRIDGAIGSSLGSTFVGQLVQRENIHIDHAIFGSPDLDQSGKFSAWLQSKLVVPLLTSFTKGEKNRILRGDHHSADLGGGLCSGQAVFLISAERGPGADKAKRHRAVLRCPDHGLGDDDPERIDDTGCGRHLHLGRLQKQLHILAVLPAVCVDLHDLQGL